MAKLRIAPITYEDVKTLVVEGDTNTFLNCRPFLPCNDVGILVQGGRIKSTLEAWFGPKQDIKHLVKYFTENAQRVFLILVLIVPGQDCIQHCVQSLYDARLTDEHLPVFKSKTDRTSPRFYARDKKHCDFFESWEMKPRDEFLSNQWTFLAPIFKKDKFSYDFYECQHLPFIPRKENYMSAGGNFADVASVGLHIQHLDPSNDCKVTTTLSYANRYTR